MKMYQYKMTLCARNLGCATVRPKVGVFLSNSWNSTFLLLYYSAHKKATAMVFIWGDRRHPAICFEYKMASEQYLVAEI